ncbi:MAG: bifunctional histidinol-phosphatase/imidazoleglycerol-phosphate dehydratase HisB [Muribaculaceae bacterium]|nr:bifunctional histidinol-phosphatase/imidazoleglycerol-phosphate dehydratase HisB [Muribaculaceae bacterium]
MATPQNKQRVLFIDRDGTLIVEPPIDYQVDSLEKLELVPGALRAMHFIASHLPFKLVMVTNQDGLGTDSFPEDTFWPAHNKMLRTFENEGVTFDDIIIDRTFEHENKPTRKPGTALLGEYLSGDYDLENSFVIGDRLSDVQLAKNLGCKAILLRDIDDVASELNEKGLSETTSIVTTSWDKVSEFLQGGSRQAMVTRNTSETKIEVSVDLDGTGKCQISTGLGFFDHMLEQIGRHSGIDLKIKTVGDLHVDEHHTIEDTAIALGDALRQALGDKRGIERYGYVLPMDDCLCTVAIDFGGRPWLVLDAEFKREKIGDMPTEMFLHFFKSLSDSARMNLFIRAEGTNEHHKIEGIFKGLARAIKMAIRRDIFKYTLPSTKGTL